jgi:hypothetical protein
LAAFSAASGVGFVAAAGRGKVLGNAGFVVCCELRTHAAVVHTVSLDRPRPRTRSTYIFVIVFVIAVVVFFVAVFIWVHLNQRLDGGWRVLFTRPVFFFFFFFFFGVAAVVVVTAVVIVAAAAIVISVFSVGAALVVGCVQAEVFRTAWLSLLRRGGAAVPARRLGRSPAGVVFHVGAALRARAEIVVVVVVLIL